MLCVGQHGLGMGWARVESGLVKVWPGHGLGWTCMGWAGHVLVWHVHGWVCNELVM
jgi:hypothetical protein